jgi:hypothetical protein
MFSASAPLKPAKPHRVEDCAAGRGPASQTAIVAQVIAEVALLEGLQRGAEELHGLLRPNFRSWGTRIDNEAFSWLAASVPVRVIQPACRPGGEAQVPQSPR